MRNRASTGAVQQISSWAIKHGEIEAEAAEEIIQTDLVSNQQETKENAALVKVRIIFTRNAPNDFAKLVVEKVMMLGVQPVSSING